MFYCSICLNLAEISKRDAHGNLRHPKVITTPCGHVYHMRCLYRWCEAKRSTNWEDGGDPEDFDVNCPMCNFNFMEEECMRLFPVEVDTNDQGVQTDPTKEERKSEDILILDTAFQNYVRRMLTEKWTAEIQGLNLKVQVQKLKVSVVELIQEKLELTLKLELADQIITAQSAQAVRTAGAVVQKSRKMRKKREGPAKGPKKMSIWQKLFKAFVNPGYDHK